MLKKRFPKPDLLVALTLLSGLGVLTATAVEADEALFDNINLFDNPYISELMDGDLQMTGNDQAGLHVSVKSESVQYTSQHSNKPASNSGVRFSWKMSF